MEVCLRVLKESNKSSFDIFIVRKYWSYPILPFGLSRSHFFPTTFLEITVYGQASVSVFDPRTSELEQFWTATL